MTIFCLFEIETFILHSIFYLIPGLRRTGREHFQDQEYDRDEDVRGRQFLKKIGRPRIAMKSDTDLDIHMSETDHNFGFGYASGHDFGQREREL